MKFGTLQVFPRQGLLREHGLDLPSAIVGRGEGSNIHIDDFSVSRRHARLTVESGRLLIEDLGSVGGTFVDGQRLEPGIRHLVGEDSSITFGEIGARYIPVEVAESLQLPESDQGLLFGGTGGLRIALVAPEVPVEPGKSIAATVVVHNAGRILDDVRIEVPDLPADWYTVDSPAVAILPAGRAEVRINLHPPRTHESIAGVYTFTARARSTEYDESPEAHGSFDVLPFEAAELSLLAIRSKRDFRLVAENHGNDVARYALSGRDDEQVFRYEFETPVVELQPGERRIINLAVRRPRQLFGAPQIPPFEISGLSDSGAEITTRGQLAVRPPLQKFRMPVMFTLVALLLAATALAVFIITDGGGTKSASAEDPYAGVHLCEDKNAKDEQAKKNEEAAKAKPLTSATVVGPYSGGRPIFGQVDSNGAPFFAQSDPRWGAQEYARSTELPNGKDWCGTTIEQCGCAMTSVTVMLALYDLLQMPDGSALSPRALNDWFNGAARKTERGWVSRGYIYGDVIWSAANELSAEIAKAYPGARTVRFVRTGSGSEDEIRAELKAGRPVILEVPGHWIAAVGLDEDGSILINDPFYRDRRTLDAYKGKVRSSVHYEPSSDLSSVVITAPADVKFKITDKQGRVVNTGTGTIDQPADALNQIPGASVASRHAWRDPTCIETAPPADAGTNQVVLPGSRDDYTIEIIGTGSEPGALAIHTYGRDGASSIATIEGGQGTKAEVAFDPNADKPVIRVDGSATPQATSTPEPGGAGGGGGDETPTPSPTRAPASPTATPFVEQRTAMTLPAEPGQTRVEVATNSGFELGDPIRFAPGLPNEEDNIIVGFGSFILATPLKFAHSPGEPIQRLPRPPGQGPGLPPGITPPPDTGPLLPPETVTMACSTIYQGSPKLATFICDVQVVGDFTTTRWTINGTVVTEFSGSTSIVMTFPGDTPANVSATVCNVTLCRSTSRNERVEFPLTATGTGTGGTGSSAAVAPTATPPAGTVTVTCTTEFNQAVTPAIANVTCTANFSGDFTGVSWSAPGGSPASGSGTKKTFTTQLKNDLNSPTSIKITATVCNFGVCFTSNPVTVGIGQTRTVVDADPPDGVPQRQTVTLLAVVTGLNGIVPQGGSVQFYADDLPLSPSAALFTVGSLAVAQVSLQTGGSAGLTTVGTHTIKAVYSGGINAFGSTSLPRDFEVLEPIPDGCDSVDEDGNGDTDETCNFAVPKNLGGGTILNSLAISGGTQDGAPNAVIATPGQDLTATGTVSRTEYCPGCIRQVYLGIGANSVASVPASGPQCVFSGFPPQTPSATGFATWGFKAPTVPGVYYIRATTTLDYFCIGPAVGPPDRSVGRIVVRSTITPQLDVFANANDAVPDSPWDNDLSGATPITRAEAGQKVLIRARVPAGATGAIDITGFTNASGNPVAVVAVICPPSGTVPSGTFMGSACVPGEARVLSPQLLDSSPSLSLTATYRNDSPLRLVDPTFGFTPPTTVTPYPVYLAGPASAPYALRILVSATVTLSAQPNPVKMGESFTLTATVRAADPNLSTFGTGGSVQFKAGTNDIGAAVPITNANGTVSITWTPRTCNNVDADQTNNCASANEGFPFNSRDDESGTVQGVVRPTYNDVHAVFTTGTSDLKGATSANINVDIDPTPSTTTITSVSVTAPTIGTPFTITSTVVATGFSPAPGVLTLKAGTNTLVTHTLTAAECPAAAGVYTCTFTTASISTGGDNDVIDASGTYSLTAQFNGSTVTQVASGTSPVFSLTFAKAAPTLAVTLPNSGTITVGASGNIVATLAGSPTNRLDDSPARLKFYNGTTQLADLAVSGLSGGAKGAELGVSSLAAGTYSITVEYTGNAYFSPITSAAQTFTVNQYTPTVTLSSISAVQVGNDVTLSANVSGSGVQSPAGGSVSFYLGSTAGTLLGTDTSIAGNGDVSLTVQTGDGKTLATAGTAYSIIAHFNGNATNGNVAAATSAAQSVTLTKRNSTVTVPTVTGQLGTTVTFTANVSSGSANVSPDCTACVQFKYGTSLSTATDIGAAQNVSSGSASLANVATGASTPFSSNATYTIWAVYTGTTNVNGNNASGSLQLATPVTVTVSAPATAITGVAVTLSATVSPATAPGTIQFKVGGTNVGSPQTVVSGSASLSWTPSSAGSYDITAAYTSNSSNYLSDPDSNTATVVVSNPTAVSVTISTAASSYQKQTAVTINVTIAPGTAPGSIRVHQDGVAVGTASNVTGGTMTIVWNSPNSAGDYSITVVYTSSSPSYQSTATSNALIITLTNPP